MLAEMNIGLVYGGGSVGLMGAVATAALDAGGEVIGVIPENLMGHELAHPRLEQLHVVETMHARKALMAQYADAFIALPGGFGTMDELFEIITWAFLGIHDKPIALIDTQGFFQPVLKLFTHMVDQDFAIDAQCEAVSVCPSPAEALHALRQNSMRRGFNAQSEQSCVQ